MFPSLATAAQAIATAAQEVAAGAVSYAEQHHLRQRRNQALRIAKAKATALYAAASSKVSSVVEDVLPRRRLDVNKDAQRAQAVPPERSGRMLEDGDDWEVQEEEFLLVESLEEFGERVKREEEEEGEMVAARPGVEVFDDIPLEDSVDRLVRKMQALELEGDQAKGWQKLMMPTVKDDVTRGKMKRRGVRVHNAVLDGVDAMFRPTCAPTTEPDNERP
ncbi:hypothetical protein B0T14DRAFT_550969 [Immersiella caudata]|uniref:Uncharacterized protein n=1 Tax=Immersiella caudata TaxID=314043 RepID=A0AA39XHM0_9PEZI|nr:hypothetical protein B0T14DRAFT_550969 [Immersiella caudata]